MYCLVFLSDRMNKLVVSPVENVGFDEDGCRQDGDHSFAVDGMFLKSHVKTVRW